MYDPADEIGESFGREFYQRLSDLYKTGKEIAQKVSAERKAHEREKRQAVIDAERARQEGFVEVDLGKYSDEDAAEILDTATRSAYPFERSEDKAVVLVQQRYLERFKRLCVNKDKELFDNEAVIVSLEHLPKNLRKNVVDRTNGRGIKIEAIDGDFANVSLARKHLSVIEGYIQKAERDALDAPLEIDLSHFNEDDRRDILYKAQEMGLVVFKLSGQEFTYRIKGENAHVLLGIIEEKEAENLGQEFVAFDISSLNDSEKDELIKRLKSERIQFVELEDRQSIEIMRKDIDVCQWHIGDIKNREENYLDPEKEEASEQEKYQHHQEHQEQQKQAEAKKSQEHSRQDEPETPAVYGAAAGGSVAVALTDDQEHLREALIDREDELKFFAVYDSYQAQVLQRTLSEAGVVYDAGGPGADGVTHFLISKNSLALNADKIGLFLTDKKMLEKINDPQKIEQLAQLREELRKVGAGTKIKGWQARPETAQSTPAKDLARAQEQIRIEEKEVIMPVVEHKEQIR